MTVSNSKPLTASNVLRKTAISVEQVKKDYLKSINKSANSYLSHEQIDDFVKFCVAQNIRIQLPLSEWKKNFARRFQRYLEREGITLEQIESQGFKHPAARRWSYVHFHFQTPQCSLWKQRPSSRCLIIRGDRFHTEGNEQTHHSQVNPQT